MPTKYRRIAVVADPELTEVLKRAARQLPGRSQAGLLKELAVRGATSLEDPSVGPRLRRLLVRKGVKPAKTDFRDYLDRRGHRTIPDQVDPYRGSKALDEQREDCI